MANDALAEPVITQATRIDASLLPRDIFSQPYLLYVIQQGQDFGNVAGKANQAGQGAYDAQVKNDEQDVILLDHETRLAEAEETLVNHEQRITKAEETLVNHEERITANEKTLADHETRLTGVEKGLNQLTDEVAEIAADYVSLSMTTAQSLASPLSVTASYSVGGVKVVGPRITGFTPSTGTASKSGLNASKTFTFSTDYDKSEIEQLASALIEARRVIKGFEDAMRKHGLID